VAGADGENRYANRRDVGVSGYDGDVAVIAGAMYGGPAGTVWSTAGANGGRPVVWK